jgi:cytochrome b6-f complex iron-sulfur subunit
MIENTAERTLEVNRKGLNRREFLYYIWGASIVMALGQATAGILWFSLPRFRKGEFGSDFEFAPETLPQVGAKPMEVPEGRFWLVNTEDGILALYAVCTHLGCLPKWQVVNGRFECPCHGAKFEFDGSYIEGPAPRNLDRFLTRIVFADGSEAVTNEDGDAVALDGRDIDLVIVDSSTRIYGRDRD